jgi:hypothetical protein
VVDYCNRLAEYGPDAASGDRLNGETTPSPAASGRDARGRFAPGNPGGPGRPPRATEALYALAVSEVVGLERFRAVLEEQTVRALQGDLAAAQWLAKLLIGANPPPLSEVLAGMLRGGPHYAVAQKVAAMEEATDGARGFSTRHERAQTLVETLGDPDPPDQPCDLPGPSLEDLARRARLEAVMDVMREFSGDEQTDAE